MVRNCVENFELKKACWVEGRKDGWMDGWKSRVKDCLQQSKIDRIWYITGPWWSSGLERCFSHSFVLELKVEGSNLRVCVVLFSWLRRSKRLNELIRVGRTAHARGQELAHAQTRYIFVCACAVTRLSVIWRHTQYDVIWRAPVSQSIVVRKYKLVEREARTSHRWMVPNN